MGDRPEQETSALGSRGSGVGQCDLDDGDEVGLVVVREWGDGGMGKSFDRIFIVQYCYVIPIWKSSTPPNIVSGQLNSFLLFHFLSQLSVSQPNLVRRSVPKPLAYLTIRPKHS